MNEGRNPIRTSDDIAQQIGELKRRLSALDRERSEIADRLRVLEQTPTVLSAAPKASGVADITMASPTAAKINLFRSLFRGRVDVFPRRWENPRTGKAGYAPACRNEWIRGIAASLRSSAESAPNQAFVSVSEEVVRWHSPGQDI